MGMVLSLTHRGRALGVVAVAVVLLAVAAGGCGATDALAPPGGKVRVAAIEATWGSLAAQVGGAHAEVVSIVSGPGADPHDFEPRPRDAVTLAQAQIVIVNGAGYDTWATKLLASTRAPGRIVIDVAAAVGAHKGANPHFWYDPRAVATVIARVTGALQQLDAAHSAAYTANRHRLETAGLATYHRLLADLRARYAGTPVGISESIFEPLAEAIGLRVVTPVSFANAIGQGTDPTAADRTTIAEQVRSRRFAVFLDNSQNSTPDVDAVVAACRRAGIPVVAMTETPTPADARFQDWQAAQLQRLAAALAEAKDGAPA